MPIIACLVGWLPGWLLCLALIPVVSLVSIVLSLSLLVFALCLSCFDLYCLPTFALLFYALLALLWLCLLLITCFPLSPCSSPPFPPPPQPPYHPQGGLIGWRLGGGSNREIDFGFGLSCVTCVRAGEAKLRGRVSAAISSRS